jgi:hypothetical protein
MVKHTTEQPPLSEKEPREPGTELNASAEREQIDRQAQNSALPEEEELDELQKRVRGFSDKKWNMIQYILGTAVGFLCGSLVTYFSSMESIGMYGTIAALVIALFVPRLSEKRLKRSLQKGRVTMMIALAVWIAATALIMAVKGVPFFI